VPCLISPSSISALSVLPAQQGPNIFGEYTFTGTLSNRLSQFLLSFKWFLDQSFSSPQSPFVSCFIGPSSKSALSVFPATQLGVSACSSNHLDNLHNATFSSNSFLHKTPTFHEPPLMSCSVGSSSMSAISALKSFSPLRHPVSASSPISASNEINSVLSSVPANIPDKKTDSLKNSPSKSPSTVRRFFVHCALSPRFYHQESIYT
jgi:hypothetical protein